MVPAFRYINCAWHWVLQGRKTTLKLLNSDSPSAGPGPARVPMLCVTALQVPMPSTQPGLGFGQHQTQNPALNRVSSRHLRQVPKAAQCQQQPHRICTQMALRLTTRQQLHKPNSRLTDAQDLWCLQHRLHSPGHHSRAPPGTATKPIRSWRTVWLLSGSLALQQH
jgi:hypothetical protein